MAKFYITTTIPYVNADPHIGFALEIIQADAIARWHRALGDEVVFNFGTDEHGQKIYQKAQEKNIPTQQYVDEYAAKFKELKEALNLSYTNFIRTTDEHHKKAAQVFWKLCKENGDIYKKNYKIKYCVGCELEKTDSELENGKCPLHPNQEIQVYEEENYFFRFSNYQKPLLDFYEKNSDFVIPQEKFNEIKSFIKAGLEDFSVSRLKKKMPWGIDVPDDSEHVMYVWFDALINYISTLGWPENEKNFKDFWPGMQVAGKDQVRQQAAMWQAMLMSAKLPNSKQIFFHGFMTVDGQKISKSLGNVINPIDMVNKYGADVLRYYLLRDIPPTSDGDFSERRLQEVYNADLANNVGNLVSRVTKLCESNNFQQTGKPSHIVDAPQYHEAMKQYKFNEALQYVIQKATKVNQYIDTEKPWELGKKNDPRLKDVLAHAIDQLQEIAVLLEPFMPETAEKIQEQLKGPEIKAQTPLFPRL